MHLAADVLGTLDAPGIRMHLATLTLTNYRNFRSLELSLPPGTVFILGANAQGKSNLQAPWLGITAFVVLSLMLSLLVFIGEALRDAFDPRK